ncbi:MAG: ATP-binding protein [Aliarcobacter sp.]|nr:ATP-binding protein [Aliarcobacter sp.]
MKELLISQNSHWIGTKLDFIKRDKLSTLLEYLPLKQIITISGIRRCGKSSLAKQAINHLIESGVNPYNIFFINLEQPYFLEYKSDANYLNTIYEEYLKLANPQGKIYVIFDEIQFFSNWQVFIKSKYESSDIKFIITGSNSSMLSNDLNTLLSGRSLNIHLDTFSFSEFLDFKEINHSNEIEKINNKIAIKRAVEEYMNWGGFYEVFSIENENLKKEILLSYAKNIIYQDIIPRYNIRNSEVVERLFFYLLSNSCAILNYTTLAKIFEISDKTIKEYINYFEDVFLLKRLDKFHNKEKEQIKSQKKIYTLDNGLLQLSTKFSQNFGQKLENLVFNVLNQNNENLTYLRDNYEIDFYTNKTLYQVSYKMDDEKTLNREINSFKYFNEDKTKESKIITLNESKNIDDIEVISIDEFIL